MIAQIESNTHIYGKEPLSLSFYIEHNNNNNQICVIFYYNVSLRLCMHKITASRNAIRLSRSNGNKSNELFIFAVVIAATVIIIICQDPSQRADRPSPVFANGQVNRVIDCQMVVAGQDQGEIFEQYSLLVRYFLPIPIPHACA